MGQEDRMEVLLQIKKKKQSKLGEPKTRAILLCKTLIKFKGDDLTKKIFNFIKQNDSIISSVKKEDIHFYIDFRKFKGGIALSSKNCLPRKIIQKQIASYLSRQIFEKL